MEVCQTLMEEIRELKEVIYEIRDMLRKKRSKRAPSEYNIFIGECMKQGKTMKECAIEYRKRKGIQ